MSFVFQLPSAQHNPNAKVAYIGVAYSDPLRTSMKNQVAAPATHTHTHNTLMRLKGRNCGFVYIIGLFFPKFNSLPPLDLWQWEIKSVSLSPSVCHFSCYQPVQNKASI